MGSKTVSTCCLAFTILAFLSSAQKQDSVRVPSPHIPLPQPKQEPRTRVNVEGAGTVGGSHRVSGSVEYDIYRSSNGGPTITGWGQGSHSSHAGGNGQAGIRLAIPIGGRRQRHRNVTDRR
ncbi:hypothetical protein MTO96_012831 [Rhipicephalus appendiculatus]